MNGGVFLLIHCDFGNFCCFDDLMSYMCDYAIDHVFIKFIDGDPVNYHFSIYEVICLSHECHSY